MTGTRGSSQQVGIRIHGRIARLQDTLHSISLTGTHESFIPGFFFHTELGRVVCFTVALLLLVVVAVVEQSLFGIDSHTIVLLVVLD